MREQLLILLSRYREASIAVVAIVLVIYFQLGSDGDFLSPSFMSVVLRDTGRLGLIAAAEVMLMITGEIDLSLSAIFSIAPYVMALLSVTYGVPLAVGAVIGVLIGILVGAINGIITVRFKVPSLITTVGTLFFLQGIVVWIYNSQPIVAPVEQPFNAIFGQSLYQPTDALLSWHGVTAFTPFLWAVLVVLVLALVLNRTTFGLHTIATGSNIIGAREIGVRTDRMKTYNFMIAGGCAAFAGIIGRPAGRQSVPDVAGDRRGGHRWHVAARRLGHRDRRANRRLRRRLAQQRPGYDRRPGDRLRHLSGCCHHRRHDPFDPGRPAAHTEARMNTQTIPPLAPDAPVVLEMTNISKSFGAVTALVDVSIRLRQGEVLALVGDNGAGKSTLIKILSGFHQPDTGTIVSQGKEVRFASPRDARAQGIETVYQDLALIGDLSVFHNMFLGREYHKRVLGLSLLDNGKMREQARLYLDTLGISIPSVNSTVDLLSGGQRQCIAVARSIYSSPKILVLDEPLAALGVRESAHVLGLIQNLRQQRRVSVILIVHNYNQIFEVCDRINFLHSGEIALDASTADTSEEELIRIVKSGLGRKAIDAAAAQVRPGPA